MSKKKNRDSAPAEARRYLRTGAILALTLSGIGLMAGMALFNGSAKPNRDMQWYVREGAVEIAAPAMGEGYAVDGGGEAKGGPSTTQRKTVEVVVAAPGAAPSNAPVVEAEALPTATAEATLQATAGQAPAGIPETTPAPEVQEEVQDVKTGEAVTLTITAVGDCTFEGETGSKAYTRFKSLAEQNGYQYFLNNVRWVLESDDLTIANLEGPLTTSTHKSAHGYVFKADPACVEILTSSSVELCNVANNHSKDYGTAGLRQTAEVLEENGVGCCGYSKAYTALIKGVRVCALGFSKWDNTRDQIIEAVSAARSDCDLLIVNMHWGWERQYQQCDAQVTLGHAIIDAGADLVIGTHPHVYQGIEKYKGKYIVYSLGNFCFAGNADPKDKRCLIFQQQFGFNPGMGIAQANIVDLGINVVPCSISSEISNNNFQPTIMSAEDGGALLKAVASHSANFSLENTTWMKGNYMVEYGLIQPTPQPGDADSPVTADLSAEDTAPSDPADDASKL